MISFFHESIIVYFIVLFINSALATLNKGAIYPKKSLKAYMKRNIDNNKAVTF